MWAPVLPKYTSYFLLSLSTRNIILLLETDASVFKAPVPRDLQRKWGTALADSFTRADTRVRAYKHTGAQSIKLNTPRTSQKPLLSRHSLLSGTSGAVDHVLSLSMGVA